LNFFNNFNIFRSRKISIHKLFIIILINNYVK